MTFSTASNLQFQASQENLLHRITSRIRQSLQLQEILQTTVTETRAFLETDRVMVYRFYPDEHGEVIAEAIDNRRLPSLLGLHFPADDIPPEARSLFLQARQRSIVDLSTGQIGSSLPQPLEVAEEISQDIQYRLVDPCHIEYLKAMGVQSSVVVPILQANQLWGLLVAHHSEPRTVTEAELRFLQLVVDQVAIAIAQANLLAQVQAQADRERIANQIATLLQGGADRRFEAALAATVAAIDGSGGRLSLLAGDAGLASELYTYGTQPLSASDGLPLEQDALWEMSLRSQALAIADLYQDARCQSLQAVFQSTPIRSLLIVPLQHGSATLGYLTLFRNEIETETLWAGKVDPDVRQTIPRRSFDEWRQHKAGQAPAWTTTDLNLIKAIQTHLALAITQYQLQTQVQALNAQLRQQVQHQSRDLANIQYALDQSAIVAITDNKGTIVYVNEKFCEISGYSRNELIGQSHHLLNSGFHSPEFFRKMWQTITAGRIWRGEIQNHTKHGREYWVDTTIVPLLDEQQKPYQYVAIRSDITARKQAEAALRYQSSLTQNVINSSTDWIFVKDLNFRYLLANQPCARAVGLTPDEVIGKTDLELGFPSEQIFGNPAKGLVGFRADDHRAISGESVFNPAEPVTTIDGSMIWMETKKLPLRDHDGKIFGVLGVCSDITERKQAEIALKRTTKRLEEAQRVAQMGSWELNVATGVVTWSDEMFRIFGMPPSSTAPSFEEHAQMFHPDDWEWFQQTVNAAIADGKPYDIEVRFRHPDGAIRLINARAEVFRNQAGEVKTLFGTVLDITERKQAEIALQKTTNSLQRVQQLAHIGSWEYHIATETITWSDETFRIFGLTPGQPMPHMAEVLNMYHPDDRERLAQVLNQALQVGTPYKDEFRIVRTDGSVRHLDTKGEALRDQSGVIVGAIGSVMDITERKQAEEALRQKIQQETLLNQLANQIRSSLDIDQILETAVESIRNLLNVDRCTFVWYRPQNHPPTWECVYDAKLPDLSTIVGVYPSESIGSAAVRLQNLEIIQDDDATLIADPQWREVLLSLGCKSNLSIPIQTNIGEIGVISCTHERSLHPWKENEVELLIAVANQLAIAINQANLYKRSRLAAKEAQAQAQQLQQALAELRQTQAQLVQTEKMSSLGQLVAGVAHEINNPVSFIYGNLNPAKEYAHGLLNLLELYQHHYPDPVPAIQAEAEAIDLDFLKTDLPKLLSSMRIGADRIQKIVLALRTFSRMDEAEVKAVNLHEGIDSTLMILQNRLKDTAGHPGIQVIKEYGELPLVECYAGQLNQVFMNILSNAIDALDEFNNTRAPQEIQNRPATITIATEQMSNQSIQIRIADNGAGMSEQVQQRLFEPFFTTKPVGKGTGLGLSISYQVVVDKHKGALTCQSTPGKGTQFVIELPLMLPG